MNETREGGLEVTSWHPEKWRWRSPFSFHGTSLKRALVAQKRGLVGKRETLTVSPSVALNPIYAHPRSKDKDDCGALTVWYPLRGEVESYFNPVRPKVALGEFEKLASKITQDVELAGDESIGRDIEGVRWKIPRERLVAILKATPELQIVVGDAAIAWHNELFSKNPEGSVYDLQDRLTQAVEEAKVVISGASAEELARAMLNGIATEGVASYLTKGSSDYSPTIVSDLNTTTSNPLINRLIKINQAKIERRGGEKEGATQP